MTPDQIHALFRPLLQLRLIRRKCLLPVRPVVNRSRGSRNDQCIRTNQAGNTGSTRPRDLRLFPGDRSGDSRGRRANRRRDRRTGHGGNNGRNRLRRLPVPHQENPVGFTRRVRSLRPLSRLRIHQKSLSLSGRIGDTYSPNRRLKPIARSRRSGQIRISHLAL